MRKVIRISICGNFISVNFCCFLSCNNIMILIAYNNRVYLLFTLHVSSLPFSFMYHLYLRFKQKQALPMKCILTDKLFKWYLGVSFMIAYGEQHHKIRGLWRRWFNSTTKENLNHTEILCSFYLKWKWQKKLLLTKTSEGAGTYRPH